MKRVKDKNYYTYSVYNAISSGAGINVKCPKCNGMGIVTADKDTAYFRCTDCGNTKTADRAVYRCAVHNKCKECGQYYRVDITDRSKQHFHALHVACPYCGYVMSGEVQKSRKYAGYISEIRKAREPFFGLELWFLTSCDDKPVWALNREHLDYLIEYLDADLREKPAEFTSMKSQADSIPTFMKTAKNRNAIVKRLKSLIDKQR